MVVVRMNKREQFFFEVGKNLALNKLPMVGLTSDGFIPSLINYKPTGHLPELSDDYRESDIYKRFIAYVEALAKKFEEQLGIELENENSKQVLQLAALLTATPCMVAYHEPTREATNKTQLNQAKISVKIGTLGNTFLEETGILADEKFQKRFLAMKEKFKEEVGDLEPGLPMAVFDNSYRTATLPRKKLVPSQTEHSIIPLSLISGYFNGIHDLATKHLVSFLVVGKSGVVRHHYHTKNSAFLEQINRTRKEDGTTSTEIIPFSKSGVVWTSTRRNGNLSTRAVGAVDNKDLVAISLWRVLGIKQIPLDEEVTKEVVSFHNKYIEYDMEQTFDRVVSFFNQHENENLAKTVINNIWQLQHENLGLTPSSDYYLSLSPLGDQLNTIKARLGSTVMRSVGDVSKYYVGMEELFVKEAPVHVGKTPINIVDDSDLDALLDNL